MFTEKNYVNSSNKCIDFVYSEDYMLVDTPSFDMALNYTEELIQNEEKRRKYEELK